jgi:Mrp family chromosome partitioning ATPase/capsular polysaccharide biosynthesis protein
MDSTVNASSLGDHLRVLRRHWLPVVLCLLLGIGSAFAYLHWAPKEYRATTSVLVTPVGGTQTLGGKNSGDMETEAELVSSTGTVSAAATRLGVSGSDTEALAGRVSVSVPPNTNILDISYTGMTAVEAQQGSMAFAEAYLDQRRQATEARLAAEDKSVQERIDVVDAQLQPVLQAMGGLTAVDPDRPRLEAQVRSLNDQLAALSNQQNQIRATVVTPGDISREAAVPSSPSSPDTLVTLVAGIVLSLFVGASLAMLRQRTDDFIRSPQDLLSRTGVRVGTVLPGRLLVGQVQVVPPLSPDGRGYARLRNLVISGLMRTDRPVVVVAGVRHGGGPVAVNLAASLARAGEDVYLLCANVSATTSAALLGGKAESGLGDVLAGDVELADAARTVPGIPNLRVLGVGRDPDRTDALLQTGSPRKLVEELLASGAYVVVEAPSTSGSPDAQTLANVAELAVLVVELDRTRAAEVVDARGQFEAVGKPVLGALIAGYGKDGDRPVVAEDEAVPTEEAATPAPMTPTGASR